jgi:hypothetical protein
MIVRTAVFRRVIRDMAVIATPVGTPVGALAHRDRDWHWSNLSIVKQRWNAVPAVLGTPRRHHRFADNGVAVLVALSAREIVNIDQSVRPGSQTSTTATELAWSGTHRRARAPNTN